MSESFNQTRKALLSQLDEAMLADQWRIRRRLNRIKPDRARNAKTSEKDEALAECRGWLEESILRREQRAATVPTISYPPELPVSQRHADIAEAIRDNQVVILCGETGSGKTTQLPKICLQLGLGIRGMIGHTQPRRIAARSVCARIAEELKCGSGSQVAYQVRFNDRTTEGTLVKLMTDGILLSETVGDRFLNRYDAIIIDEAHERSLNIDFLLGYLKHILPKRPDLKLIITSATIDPQRFARHFDDAPVIEVSGRTYPVHVEYRPLQQGENDGEARDLVDAVVETVQEITWMESPTDRGDILVFFSGEREIREAADALQRREFKATEILPLYSRLSPSEQQRIFRPTGKRHIVLATNIAETSLTVPGIRYVIDSGTARISRYSHRLKIQRLPVEPVSQASANQRAGRCGRVSAGICYRLYAEEDFQQRPAFTEPEILRTNLAAVILQMKALRLGSIEDFPFVEPPDPRYVRDGERQLRELGAMDEADRLTGIGRQLMRLPIDPRIGRMLLAANEQGCLSEMLVIASALESPDIRERPVEKQQAADQAHAPFRDKQSDFMTLLNLWMHLQDKGRELSNNQLRKYCQKHYLSWLRLREWRETHNQLRQLMREMGFRLNKREADTEAIHRALLTGLLGHIGHQNEDGSYQGARNSHFYVFPGSGLAKKPPAWVVAAEIVETSRIFARTVAKVEPVWIEQAGAHLLRREYYEPGWDPRRGYVNAYERVSLYGLVLASERRVNFGSVDAEAAREIFIREALVARRYESKAKFWQHNENVIGEIEALENRQRRRDVLVDDEILYAFYDERIPAGIHNHRAFEKWRKQAERDEPRLLYMSAEDLMQHDAAGVTVDLYPDHLDIRGNALRLHYHFTPGEQVDGVSIDVPVFLLPNLSPADFEWLVPGLLEEKVTALIKSLPKPVRKHYVPAPEFSQACIEALREGQGSLLAQLADQLQRMTGHRPGDDDWRPEQIPSHLQMRLQVLDESGKLINAGRDLLQLQQELGGRAEHSLEHFIDDDYEREHITQWDFGELPETVEIIQGRQRIRMYPTLWDCTDTVTLTLSATPEEAQAQSYWGVLRLCMLHNRTQQKELQKRLKPLQSHCLSYAAFTINEALYAPDDRPLCEAMLQQAALKVAESVYVSGKALPRDEAAFEQVCDQGRHLLLSKGDAMLRTLQQVFALFRDINDALQDLQAGSDIEQDIRSQLSFLLFQGFLEVVEPEWLAEYPRFLKAIRTRLQRHANNPPRDAQLLQKVQPFWQRYVDAVEEWVGQGYDPAPLSELHWVIEEYRVSLFAQELGTKEKVSEKRLQALFAAHDISA